MEPIDRLEITDRNTGQDVQSYKQCQSAQNMFDTMVALRKHTSKVQVKEQERECHQLKNHVCRKCLFYTPSVMQWQKHVKEECLQRTSHEMCFISKTIVNICTIYKCELCPYFTQLICLMLNHLRCHYRGPQLFDCSITIRRYNCKHCNLKFATILHLTEHIHKVHLKKDLNFVLMNYYFCRNCLFDSDSSLQSLKHVMNTRSGHQIHDLDSAADKWFQCEKCAFKTKSKSVIDKHSCDQTLIRCGKCSYVTNRKKHLKYHEKIRHWNKRLKCDECPYETKYMAHLTRHLIVKHYDESTDKCHKSTLTTSKARHKTFKCDECTFETGRKNNLPKHKLRKHADRRDEKWLKCHQCTFKTVSERSIHQHAKKHAADKDKLWFKCEQCPFQTLHKGNFDKHVFAKHTEEWFTCGECAFKTKYKRSLNNHVFLKHSDDRNKEWFYCKKCPYKSTMKSYLAQHLKGKHPHGDPIWYNCE